MTDDARHVLVAAQASRIFPGAAAEVGSSGGVLWRDVVGTLTFDDPTPIDLHTPFDLASLTKVIATTTAVMSLVGSPRGDIAPGVRLDDHLELHFGEWRGHDREAATVRDLLEHASGLPARLVDAPPVARREFEHEICTIRLECAPRRQSIYSDLGFILLGFLVADVTGEALDARFSAIWPDPSLTFGLSGGARRRAAPTQPLEEDLRRGRTLVGEVHDNYAAALGGVAGHAGLFGDAPAVGAFARTILRAARGDESEREPFSAAMIAQFTTRSTVPGSSRALGWDTMLPTSSCGTRMSTAAFGHVGFTGTSLWIDPVRDRYFVLLTNRACGGGTIDDMRVVRQSFHDALGDV
ncbi:MAG TPA: serine hydrolase domain-containing protein [Vicinamibacterales bacterium]|jgi:CubicO group peptidase (beta-lactamase class C family)|nr:serine hydrolase domain-containing protein [Vicinamibacterales bacterium]